MYTLFIISVKNIEAEIHFKNKRNSSIKHISKINFTKVSARKKNHTKKKNHERQFKTYCNLISTLLRETKGSYYKQYFRGNKKQETSMADHKGDNQHEKQI